MERLLEIQESINKLDKEKEVIIDEIFKKECKTIREWKEILPEKDFGKVMIKLFAYVFSRAHGSDYFSWNTKEYIQADFEKFCDMELEENNRRFYDYGHERFFGLMQPSGNCTVRSREQTTTKEIKDGKLIYSFNWQAYNGFNISVGSGRQTFTMDLEDNCKITRQSDSRIRYGEEFFGFDLIYKNKKQ